MQHQANIDQMVQIAFDKMQACNMQFVLIIKIARSAKIRNFFKCNDMMPVFIEGKSIGILTCRIINSNCQCILHEQNNVQFVLRLYMYII